MVIVMFSFMVTAKCRLGLDILVIVFMVSCGHKSFARSLKQSSQTEAGIQSHCDCSIPPITNSNKISSDLNKAIKESLKPAYYKKYGIFEFFEKFLEDAIAQENGRKIEILKSINQHLAAVPESQILKMFELDVKSGGNESEIKLVLSQILSAVGSDVPAIRDLAERYKLKINMNTHVDDNGAQLGQLKTVSLESDKFIFERTKATVTYARCNVNNRIMDLGSKATCAFSNKMTGNIKIKITDSFSSGGNFSTSEFNTPEGGFFLQYQFN